MKLFSIIILCLFCFCKDKNYDALDKYVNFQSKNTNIDTLDWHVEKFVSNPESLNIKVIYQEKYGMERTIFCKVVFRNDKTKQYKLLSPSMNLILEMSNIVSLNLSEELTK